MIVTREQLLDIIRISNDKQIAITTFENKYFPSRRIGAGDFFKYTDTPEFRQYQSIADMLRDYLNQLEYDAILDIEALMDYGRELSYYHGISNLRELTENNEENNSELLRPKNYFTNARAFFAQTYPSPMGAHDAVIYLSGKPLAQYLTYAMEALGL